MAYSLHLALFDASADVSDQGLDPLFKLLAADGVFDAATEAGHLVGVGPVNKGLLLHWISLVLELSTPLLC